MNRGIIIPYALIATGLTMVGLWNNVLGGSTALFGPILVKGYDVSDMFFIGRALGALLLVAAARPLARRWREAVVAATVAMSFAGFLCLISCHQDLVNPVSLAWFATAAGSLGYTLASTSFYLLLATLGTPAGIALSIAASIALEVIISAPTATLANETIQGILTILVPLGAGATFCLAARHIPDAQKLQVEPEKHQGFPRERSAALIRLVIIVVALVAIRTMSDVGIWGQSRGSYLGRADFSLLHAGIVSAFVVALTIVIYVIPWHLTLAARSVLGFTLVVAGLQGLALIDSSGSSPVFSNFTYVCESFSHVLMWMAFIDCVQDDRTLGYQIGGVKNIVYVLSVSCFALALNAGIPINLLAMVTVYILLVVLVLTLLPTFSHSEEPQKDGEIESNRLFEEFCARHALSPRESQVARLLFEGHTRRDIESALGVSEGTVRTYVSRTYDKLGVHSRSEIRHLFERELIENNHSHDL